jgi:hypothetical protein
MRSLIRLFWRVRKKENLLEDDQWVAKNVSSLEIYEFNFSSQPFSSYLLDYEKHFSEFKILSDVKHFAVAFAMAFSNKQKFEL